MASEAVFGLVGVAVGSTASLLAVYLTQNLEEKRQERKSLAEREEKAISQVYSPLVFILEKTQNMFVSITALKATYQLIPEGKEGGNLALSILHYTVAREATKYPKVLEDLLLHKAGLIKSPLFYIDLVNLQSYLSTTVNLLDSLIMKSMEKPAVLEKILSSFSPLIAELSKAIGAMRIYSMQMAIRKKANYKWFFDGQKYSELEGYINEASKAITGEEVPDWEDLLKGLKNNS